MKLVCEHIPTGGPLARRSVLAGLACSCLGIASCAANPATGQKNYVGLSSINDDIRTGSSQFPELVKAYGGAYDNARLQGYVTSIGKRVAAVTELPDLPYEFVVLNSPIVNAFALPGGKVAISRGLLALASSEAEVASVLAHETGHVNARHGAQGQGRATLANLGLAILGIATGSNELMQLGQTVAQGFLQSYSREQEFEADTLGVRYMARAGYDPAASPSFLASLREQSQVEAEMNGLPPGQTDQFNIMASHPRTVERVRQAQAEAQAQDVADPVVNHEAYLDNINGLLFADDPEQGLVRGRTFIHTGLRIAFDAPDGFILRNAANNVSAQTRDGANLVFDSAPVQRARNLTDYIQYEWAGNVRLQSLENITVNGIPAATGFARLNNNGGWVDVRLVAYGLDRGRVYRFVFAAPSRLAQNYNTGFRAATYSFRRIDDAEAKAARPLRVIVVSAREGDTVARLAQSLPYGRFNEAWFRVLNDLGPSQNITPGQTLKIITG